MIFMAMMWWVPNQLWLAWNIHHWTNQMNHIEVILFTTRLCVSNHRIYILLIKLFRSRRINSDASRFSSEFLHITGNKSLWSFPSENLNDMKGLFGTWDALKSSRLRNLIEIANYSKHWFIEYSFKKLFIMNKNNNSVTFLSSNIAKKWLEVE